MINFEHSTDLSDKKVIRFLRQRDLRSDFPIDQLYPAPSHYLKQRCAIVN